jgi:hypothetical protein
MTALAALTMLLALVSGGCRGTEESTKTAAAPTLSQEAGRPQQGTNWSADAPPPVTGATGFENAYDPATAERERELAQREAALAQREAAVAQREMEAAAAPAPRVAPRTTTRRTTSTRASAPAPRPRRSETQTASRDSSPRDYEPAPAPRREPAPTRVTIPAGTNIAAEITDGASTASSQVGDSVAARVAENVYAGGELAIPAGSRLYGTVTDVQGLRRVGGRARLAVRFDSVELPNGTRAPIYAAWSAQGRNETGRDAATIGGSAAGGAVLGRVLSRGRRQDERTAQGAAVGAVIGTVIAARNQRNGQVELAAGSTVDLTLSDTVRVTVS